jgi:hypothetical protein
MIIGTNWFLGFSHWSLAKDEYIREHLASDRRKIADVIEVFFRAGVNAVMGLGDMPPLAEAIKEAEDRTGVEGILISTPLLPFDASTPMNGFDEGVVAEILDRQVAVGAKILMPHQSTTDAMVCRCARKVRQMDTIAKMTRDRGMIPGLSTHMPEAIVYADESGLDCETYISIYNAMGFLMQVEVDWTARVIGEAQKPVMTIKPMASGQLRPFQAMHFVWSTLREQDMVTVGTMSPKEAAELVDISMGILDKQSAAKPKLQETRSKASIKPAKV